MIHFTVGVYVTKADSGDEQWTALTPVAHYAYVQGQGEVKLRERIIDRVRDTLRRATPQQQELYQFPIGTELMRLPVELKLEDGKVTGTVPIIVEPRWTSADKQHFLAYHPKRRFEFFFRWLHVSIGRIVPDIQFRIVFG